MADFICTECKHHGPRPSGRHSHAGCKYNLPGAFAAPNSPISPSPEPPLISFPSGASSSIIPRFDYIPRRALLRLIRRFELGVTNHKDRAWNARQNPQFLQDKEFLIARLTHCIDHAYKLIDRLEGRLEQDGDDDAAAIAFCGILLCEATEPQGEAGPLRPGDK